jgi:hypothetical protein
MLSDEGRGGGGGFLTAARGRASEDGDVVPWNVLPETAGLWLRGSPVWQEEGRICQEKIWDGGGGFDHGSQFHLQ